MVRKENETNKRFKKSGQHYWMAFIGVRDFGNHSCIDCYYYRFRGTTRSFSIGFDSRNIGFDSRHHIANQTIVVKRETGHKGVASHYRNCINRLAGNFNRTTASIIKPTMSNEPSTIKHRSLLCNCCSSWRFVQTLLL